MCRHVVFWWLCLDLWIAGVGWGWGSRASGSGIDLELFVDVLLGNLVDGKGRKKKGEGEMGR